MTSINVGERETWRVSLHDASEPGRWRKEQDPYPGKADGAKHKVRASGMLNKIRSHPMATSIHTTAES